MKINRLIIPLLLAVLLPGCANSDGRTISVTGATLVVPKEWRVNDKVQYLLVQAISPLENGGDSFQENISLTVEEFATPSAAAGALDTALEQMKKTLPKFALVERSNNRCVYTFEIYEFKLEQVKYAYVSGKKMYVLTCSALPTTFDRYLPVFEKIAASVRID